MKKSFYSYIFFLSCIFSCWTLASANLKLKTGNIDTSKTPSINVSKLSLQKASISSVKTPYIIQFKGPVKNSWKKDLKDAGFQTLNYLPDNAFIVLMTPPQISNLENFDFIQWIGEYKAEYKVSPVISVRLNQITFAAATPNDALSKINICCLPNSDLQALKAFLASNNVEIIAEVNYALMPSLTVNMPLALVDSIANFSEVEWLEPYVQMKLLNDVAASSDLMNVIPVWNTHGLDGTGQIIGHADTGLDIGVNDGSLHPDFTGKVCFATGIGRPGLWNDADGHGTHTAGSILASGDASSGQFKGIAYKAKIAHQSLLNSSGGITTPNDLADLYYQAYTNGARIHSDSWGGNAGGSYYLYDRETDLFMWQNPEMLIVYAAGNDGVDGNSDGVIDLHSISSPASAKNVLAVGASESKRNLAIPWSAFNDPTVIYPLNPIKDDCVAWPEDGVNQGMAAFSSRGPCADERVKPDIVAPGTLIISSQSQDPAAGTGWGSYNSMYSYNCGTSMSTPLVAGAAALVRQYYDQYRSLTNPTAALIKATLINGANSLYPGQYGTASYQEIPNGARPNNVEGWGQIDLETTLFPENDAELNFYDRQFISTGESNIFYFSANQDFSVTLAWTDYPGSSAANTALVNDLDLYVITPAGTTNFASQASGPDHLNNVVGVDLNSPAGLCKIIVKGYNVPQGPQPYALVMTHAIPEPTFGLFFVFMLFFKYRNQS